MKLNNKGFAISSMLYSILLLFLMLIVGVLAILGNRKVILDKVKNEIVTDLTQNRAYSFSFAHKDILLANTSKVSDFTFDLLDDVKLLDQNGNVIQTEITTTSVPSFDATKNGKYVITYRANYQGNIIEEERTIEVIDPITYEYAYTGKEQQFIAPTNGVYRTELWGAQGGSISGKAYKQDGSVRANNLTYTGGKGAYARGNIILGMGTNLYIYVGGTPEENTSLTASSGTTIGGYNGGASISAGQNAYGVGGGGATDIRLTNGSWNDFNGLKSRIIVAAGGGGANFRNEGYGEGNGGEGGTLNGLNGYQALVEGSYFRNDYPNGYQIGLGATQTKGGALEKHLLNGDVQKQSANGTFGGLNASEIQSGGGGGYYSGASAAHGGAGGGSSFISGMSGCNAISENATIDNLTHTGQAKHYSGYTFENNIMKSGKEAMPTFDGSETMVGNEGNGYVKITALIIDNGKVATNLVKNSGFEKTTDWSLSNANIVSNLSKSGNSSLQYQVGGISMSSQNVAAPTPSHVYYGSVEFLSTSTFSTADDRFEIYQSDTENGTMVFARKSNRTVEWMKLSSIQGLQTPNSGSWKIRNFLVNATETAYVDDVFIIDLTEIYGAGNEPTKQWCDANIHYFDGVGIVPNY
ncbi:MAG: hypothetical protein HFH09_04855 [Bacilli bacterium]|jgi:hypothetical protein|nr:hypothetical protein [Bacilli bacterium]